MRDGIQRFTCPNCYITSTSGTWDTSTASRFKVGVKEIEPVVKGFGDYFSQYVCPNCSKTISGDQLVPQKGY
ncbi:hypothetical protein [Ammoniphilus sp. YIM 78166]|uniref:hypothetical protein n=1 Tax=Ammoniphilus sp. YIM 78166 TaxID=1644106 RepID=UPI00106F5577|nr:hypothetical protein [Ammoniphilus sp. YIM 78166]